MIDLTAPLNNFDDLLGYFYAGCKPKESWAIGLEHEVFLLTKSGKRAEYDPHIACLLSSFADKYSWQPYYEAGYLIALKKDGSAITLEPGGQFELSGAPYKTLQQVSLELQHYYECLNPLLKELNLTVLSLGCDPHTVLQDVPWMPKKRYGIMAPYMKQKGTLGQEMMTSTSTVQVNLDYSSQADMIKKFRVSVALQSIATALFANSPMKNGQRGAYQSYRRHIWTDTDADRCGLPLFVFDEDMSFAKYAHYALDVPMYFIIRNGHYISMAGASFKDFMAGRLKCDEQPCVQDWVDHLTTVFTEVRLKSYLEMRGADSGNYDHLMALPAFWVGLLYDEATCDKAYDWISGWSKGTLESMALEASKNGIHALKNECETALALAHKGLQTVEPSSEHHLKYLDYILETKTSAADRFLASYSS